MKAIPSGLIHRILKPVTLQGDETHNRITAVQHVLVTIFPAQKALKTLAPDFKWAGHLKTSKGSILQNSFYLTCGLSQG